MIFSRHTLLMSLFVFTLLAIISTYTMRRANWNSMKLSSIILFLGVIRFLTPFELFHATIIKDRLFYPILDRSLREEYFNSIPLEHILCFIWLLGSIIYLLCLAFRLYRQWNFLKSCSLPDNHPLYELCHESAKHIGMSYNGTIVKHPDYIIPGMMGVLHPNILLPINVESIPKESLSLIFCHELYHFKSKDPWIKFGIEVLCALLWWNPVVYLLRNAIEHMLELRCDKNVCTLLTDEEKIAYTDTLLLIAKNQSSSRNVFMSKYTNKKTPSKLNYRIRQIFVEKKAKVSCIQVFLLIVSIALFVLSYCFTWQPSFAPPTVEYETVVENSQKNDTFILRQSDGTLMYFENGKHRANLTEDMLKEEPYCNIRIHNGY